MTSRKGAASTKETNMGELQGIVRFTFRPVGLFTLYQAL